MHLRTATKSGVNVRSTEEEGKLDEVSVLVPLTIGAGSGRAVVDLLLAVEACVSCGALAEVASVGVVSTAASIGTGPVCTRHGAQLAVVAIETVRASAGICVLQILRREKIEKVKIFLAIAADTENSRHRASGFLCSSVKLFSGDQQHLQCSSLRCDRGFQHIR